MSRVMVEAQVCTENARAAGKPQFYIEMLGSNVPYSFDEFCSVKDPNKPKTIPITLHVSGDVYQSANARCNKYDKPATYVYLSSPRPRRNRSEPSLTDFLLDRGFKIKDFVWLEIDRSTSPNEISLRRK
jgi:hypothetical protein